MPALLHEPDFRRLWTVGVIGYYVRWMEILVFGVFAYERTDSAFLVASMLMLRLLPLGVLGVPLGALAARVPRREMLIATTVVLAATSMTLLLISMTGNLEYWHLATASFISGVAWAGDNPLRRAFMGSIAGHTRMGAAMALDVGASNASRLAGPLTGGLILAHVGIGAVFGLVLTLYVLSLAALLRVRGEEAHRSSATVGIVASLSAGFIAARDNPRLAGALWITVLFNLFGWPVLSMVPVIGRDRLGLAADGIGLLASVDGVGTLLGAVVLASFARPALYGRIYVSGVTLFLVMLPAFALSTHPLAAAAALLMVGFGQSAFSVMQATIVFVSAPIERRVHAMGLLTMCIGTGPIGFLALGALAERFGASAASVASALAGLVALGLTWRWWRACWQDGASAGGVVAVH
jgi:MFS family permease